jgi:hypothetical protein
MKKWLPEFTPILRLLTVFGIGAAGVQAALHRGQESVSEPLAKPSIQMVDAPLVRTAVQRPKPRPEVPSANIANPRPLPDDFSPIELSQALLEELSRGGPAVPGLAHLEGVSFEAATRPPSDPLFSHQTSVPVEDTAQFDDSDGEVAARLAHDLSAQASIAASPLAYGEPAANSARQVAFDAQPSLSSPATSGY